MKSTRPKIIESLWKDASILRVWSPVLRTRGIFALDPGELDALAKDIRNALADHGQHLDLAALLQFMAKELRRQRCR